MTELLINTFYELISVDNIKIINYIYVQEYDKTNNSISFIDLSYNDIIMSRKSTTYLDKFLIKELDITKSDDMQLVLDSITKISYNIFLIYLLEQNFSYENRLAFTSIIKKLIKHCNNDIKVSTISTVFSKSINEIINKILRLGYEKCNDLLSNDRFDYSTILAVDYLISQILNDDYNMYFMCNMLSYEKHTSILTRNNNCRRY